MPVSATLHVHDARREEGETLFLASEHQPARGPNGRRAAIHGDFPPTDGPAGNQPFQVDTDGASNALWGACHSLERYGFVAFPNNYNSGRVAFIIGTEGTVYRANLPGSYVATVVTGSAPSVTFAGANLPPGLSALEYSSPPAGWSKID